MASRVVARRIHSGCWLLAGFSVGGCRSCYHFRSGGSSILDHDVTADRGDNWPPIPTGVTVDEQGVAHLVNGRLCNGRAYRMDPVRGIPAVRTGQVARSACVAPHCLVRRSVLTILCRRGIG